VEADAHGFARLVRHFPKRADELRARARSITDPPPDLNISADKIWRLSQLWLTFLDGEDFGLTIDEGIYREVKQLANSAPRCSIEEEAGQWMLINATSMSEDEIELALWCAVDRVGHALVINGNFDETLQILLSHRRGSS